MGTKTSCIPCANEASTGNQNPMSSLKTSAQNIMKMLCVIEDEILPMTREGVNRGNKVFGAAILDSADLTVVHANTNNEMECPLLHGEVHTIMEWSKVVPPSERGSAAQSSIFLSTHEPCCMCISSIVWAGFKSIYYFFPYAVTTNQGIPWDVEIMHELWGVESYQRENKFSKAACLMDLIEELEESDDETKLLKNACKEKMIKLKILYDELSSKYHAEKANNADNSLVMK